MHRILFLLLETQVTALKSCQDFQHVLYPSSNGPHISVLDMPIIHMLPGSCQSVKKHRRHQRRQEFQSSFRRTQSQLRLLNGARKDMGKAGKSKQAIHAGKLLV